MAATLKKLFNPLRLTTTASRLGGYSVPAGKRLDGFELLLVNTSSQEQGVDLYLGTSAGTSTQLYTQQANGLRIPGHTILPLPSRQVLLAGDGIWAKASANASLSVHASGVEVDASGAVPNKLFAPRLAHTTAVYPYMVPSGKVCANLELVVCNTASQQVELSGNFVPSGGGPSGVNRSAQDWAVDPGVTVVIPLRQVLEAGDRIRVSASQSNALAIHGSGYEVPQS